MPPSDPARTSVRLSSLFDEAFVFPLEAREPAAAIGQMLSAAGPSRMRLRIDVELQRVAFGAIGGISEELGAVRHHHLDAMIVGMNFLLHGTSPSFDVVADCASPIEHLAIGHKPFGRRGASDFARSGFAS